MVYAQRALHGTATARNKGRILINPHSGAFMGCWPGCAELESIPVSALGKVEVISVDYREGPDNKFPAASEDVAAVYKELLKTHKSEHIGFMAVPREVCRRRCRLLGFKSILCPNLVQLGFFAHPQVRR